MDIYGDDIDSLLAGNDELNQNINTDPGIFDATEADNDDNAADNDDDDNTAGKPVEAKKRAIRNPQLRLNVERLKSDRGIQAIDDYFTDFKFLGKGHERQDLNNVMKRIEHWGHRLYPKYNFDDFIETTEKLGKKKQIQTYMNMYRQGLLEKVDVPIADDHSDHENDGIERGNGEPEPIDEFDDLIGQQIERYRTLPPKTPAHETSFDTIRNTSSLLATPSFSSRAAVASTPMSDIYPLPSSPVPATPAPSTLTSDQMARIAENRRLAQERLRAKREQQQLQLAVQAEPVDEMIVDIQTTTTTAAAEPTNTQVIGETTSCDT